MCVHNETSTGVTSNIAAVRKAMDAEKHPALLMVDTVSSLASIDYRHDEWGVDVTIGGSQKGLMLPPGLGFNAVSQKALSASESARLPRAFWSWEEMRGPNKTGYFPSTPATNLLYGLREAISMLHEEGLEQVFQRHLRLGEATRRAVRGWGLELLCLNPAEYSPSCTAVLMPSGFEEAQFRSVVLEHYNLSLGAGLGKVAGRVFRIGHLGDLNDLMLCGALCGVEMGLARSGIPHQPGGVSAAMGFLRGVVVQCQCQCQCQCQLDVAVLSNRARSRARSIDSFELHLASGKRKRVKRVKRDASLHDTGTDTSSAPDLTV